MLLSKVPYKPVVYSLFPWWAIMLELYLVCCQHLALTCEHFVHWLFLLSRHHTCFSCIITLYWACNESICWLSNFELLAWQQFEFCCNFSSEQLVPIFKFCKYITPFQRVQERNVILGININRYCIKMNRVLQWVSVPGGRPTHHKLYCVPGYTDFIFWVVHQTFQMHSSNKPQR